MPEKKRSVRTARLRSAISFLTSIPLGTAPVPPPLVKSNSFNSEPDSSSTQPYGFHPDNPILEDVSRQNNISQVVSSPGIASGTGLASVPSSMAITSIPDSHRISSPFEKPDTTDITIRARGPAFRHITSRGQRESPLFRTALVQDGVLDGRIIFARNKEYPSGIFSLIRYDAKVESELVKQRQLAATNMLLGTTVDDESLPHWKRWKGRSYAQMLHAEYAPCSAERDELAAINVEESAIAALVENEMPTGGHPPRDAYQPLALDDPSIDLEKQRRTYARDGYMFSLLTFRNERSQKDDINEKFSRVHPWLDFGDGQGLTLSKIRSLKKRAMEIWWANDWEVATVALAIVYFEKLVFKRIINKANRKLAMCCCLLLAYKMNEARELETVTVKHVIEELESAFSTPKKQIIRAEFPVFKHLSFGMKVPTSYASPHLARLLTIKGSTMNEYFGAELYQEYLDLAADEYDPSEDDHTRSHRRSSSKHSVTSDHSSKPRRKRRHSISTADTHSVHSHHEQDAR